MFNVGEVVSPYSSSICLFFCLVTEPRNILDTVTDTGIVKVLCLSRQLRFRVQGWRKKSKNIISVNYPPL